MKKINKIIYVIVSIISMLLLVYIMKLNVLPKKYFVVAISVLLFWLLLSGILSFKIKKKIFSIILSILMIMSLCVNALGFYYVYKTDKFFKSLSEIKEVKTYYLVVKKESKFKKVTDLNNKSIAVLKNELDDYSTVLKKVKSSIKFNEKKYSNVTTTINDLYDEKIDSFLIDAGTKTIIDENIKDFESKTRIIETYSVDIIKKENKEAKEKELEKKKNDIFNIYVSGIDIAGDINTVSRSDVNIIITVNRRTNQIVLTSVPRDTQVQLHGTTGLKDKLTHAGLYGIDMSRTTLEDFLDIKIDYYVRVNFTGVPQIVDTIGGIDVYNDVAFTKRGRYYAIGNIHLNGDETLSYCRERLRMPSGDWTRGLHQEEVLKAIIRKSMSNKEILTKYPQMLEDLGYLVQTNIPDSLIKDYVKYQLDTSAEWEINSYAVAGAGEYDYLETYTFPGEKLYVQYPHEGHRQHAHKVITSIEKGKRYSEIEW